MDHFENKRLSPRTAKTIDFKIQQQLKGLKIRAKDRPACFSIAFINMENLSRVLMLQ
jgi:hypothetical protein